MRHSMKLYEKEDETYDVPKGEHTLPTCERVPAGPQLTRNERPSASPESMKACSWPVNTEAERSTLAYFLEGRNGAGSMNCAKDVRCSTPLVSTAT